jgi:23S rRNA pseudouridine1911/1915/1917 synthase
VNEVIPAALSGQRVDRVVAMLADVPRAEAERLVGAGAVLVNGVAVRSKSSRVAEGDRLDVDVAGAAPAVMAADPSVELHVVHADDSIIVVDKPAGLVVHPGAGHPTGTLVNALLARFPDLATAGAGDPARPGIVHRLDAGTTGLLVVARTAEAYESLVAQLASRDVERRYLALVVGTVEGPAGMVDARIGRSATDPTRMTVSSRGKEARTRYEVLARYDEPIPATLLECRLETGRTHQIRVHLRAIGHPVLGDARYGGVRAAVALSRPFLHAYRLSFVHPSSGEVVAFESPLPPDLEAIRGRFS